MSKLSDGIRSVKDGAKGGLSSAKTIAAETSGTARKKTTVALEKGRTAASRGMQTSKDLTYKAMEKSGDTFDKNPLAIVLGGLALGAIVGALLPNTERENRVMGKAGKKLNKKARQMADAAKEAGREKIDNLGLNGDTFRDQFRGLVDKASEAVKAASKAASDAARNRD